MIINRITTVKPVNQCPSLDTIKSVEQEEECPEELSSDVASFRRRSRLTLNSDFFNNLWPLILDENRCHIKSKSTAYFKPLPRFDALWAHTLLADKKFKDYTAPTVLTCKKPAKESTVYTREEQKCNKVFGATVPTLNEQLDEIQKDIQLGQRLSLDFIMRQRPWYMKMSIFDEDFEVTDEMIAQFTDPFQLRIAKAIQEFKCKLLVLDMAVDVCIGEMERWIPFCKFVNILVVARDRAKGRQLSSLGNIFYVIELDECLENSWQEELENALKESYRCAYECNLLETITSEFIFAFSRDRGLCKIDTFEVICKSI